MPKVLEELEVRLDRLDLEQRQVIGQRSSAGRIDTPTRGAGIHLSGILRYLAEVSGILKAIQDIDAERLPLRMALGLAWEEFAASLYPGMIWQPGQIQPQGIWMTCDGLSEIAHQPPVADASPLGASPCIEEFKLTWKKTHANGLDLLKDEWYWIQQAKGYLWGYGSRLWRLHACHVNGDYTKREPVYKRYLIQFSDNEIRLCEYMLIKNKDAAIHHGYSEKGTKPTT